MKKFMAVRLLLKATTSILILSASAFGLPMGAAHAAGTDPALPGLVPSSSEASADEILVTGTRVNRNGFQAPTPMTILGVGEIERAGSSNIASVVNQLPAFQPTFTPSSRVLGTANVGGTFLDLRGLGANRTLVLLNGRRVVAASSSGLVDINMIPQVLVDRVDVVTGGASAAWGSDAVSGVVNFVLNEQFTGLKGSAQSGISGRGDNAEQRVSLAYGRGFGDGRGHFTVSGEFFTGRGIGDQTSRKWSAPGWQTIANPAYTPTNGQPRFLIAANVHQSNRTEGGLILSSALAGQQFLPDGSLAAFGRGSIAGSAYMIGGDGINQGDYNSLVAPYDRQSAMATLGYDFSEAIRFKAEASFNASQGNNSLTQSFNTTPYVITAQNAFLSSDLRQRMANEGISSFTMGRINTDFGFIQNENKNRTWRIAAGFDGDLGNGWIWSAYYQHGKSHTESYLRDNLITANMTKAVDSVLANGVATCRVNADANAGNDDPACVPINLFGYGAPSAAAIKYVTGTSSHIHDIRQSVAAADIKGEPFATWAGPVSIAAGAEYRYEGLTGVGDSLSAANAFLIGNPKSIKGHYHVKEIFGEIVVPLAKNLPLAQALDLNAAVRLTDYSTSGSVTTWKAGATYRPIDGLLLRVTRSRDIRAPNIAELFTASTMGYSTIVDPRDNSSVFVPVFTGGNKDLDPETANTLTAGIVIEPSAVPSLRLAVDYYSIKIKGATTTIAYQDIVDRCNQGAASLCPFVARNSAGAITSVSRLFVNLARVETEGVDFEMVYGMDLGNGRLSARLLTSYIDKLVTDDGVTAVDRAGELSNGNGGVPHWRGSASVTYDTGPFSGTLKGRFIGNGKYNNTYTADDINDNTVPSVFYADVGFEWTLPLSGNNDVKFFANINNMFDKDPPIAPVTFQNAFATNPILYDVVGRSFVVGVRVKV